MKVGLFIDTWYPMVDGVIKVVDNYARRDLYLNWDDVVRDVYNDYNALLWSLRNE